jgi:hypothetical protein
MASVRVAWFLDVVAVVAGALTARPSVWCLLWTAPRTGPTGQGQTGGDSPAWDHQLAVQPGPGAMVTVKRIIEGGDYRIGAAPRPPSMTHP